MRISTTQMFDRGVYAMQTQQSDLAKTQLQIATGRKMVVPSDDPVRAARSLELQQSQSVNNQFLQNIGYAQDSMSLVLTRLDGMHDTLQYMRDKFVQAGNAGLAESDRAAIAQDLRSQLDSLVGLANSQDGQGDYLFSGFSSGTPAISLGATAYSYDGDANQRQMQVGASRLVDVSVPGGSSPTTQGLFGVDGDEAKFLNDLRAAIDTIDPATSGGSANAGAGIQAVDSFMTRVQGFQARTGSQLAELDALTIIGQSLDTEYATTRSRIEDLDYTEAISRLAQQQQVLQAAQQSFVKVSGLSLFNYLG